MPHALGTWLGVESARSFVVVFLFENAHVTAGAGHRRVTSSFKHLFYPITFWTEKPVLQIQEPNMEATNQLVIQSFF